MTSHDRFFPALFVLLWATGFIGARYAMPWSEPFSFLAVRFSIAFLILGACAFALGARFPDGRGAMHSIITGSLVHGLYLGGVFWAISQGMPAGLSALIMGLQPLLVALAAGPLLGERVTPQHWAGLGIGLAGVVIVLAPDLGRPGAGVDAATVAACLVAVTAISAGTIWQKRFATGTDLVAGTMWQYAGAAALMGIGSLAFETRAYTLTGELVFAMTWLVLVLSIGAIFLLMRLIRDGAVAKVSSLFYLVPGVTAVLGWALFGETLGPVQIAGMAVAACGVAIAARR